MKKVIYLFITIIIAILLVACGNKSNKEVNLNDLIETKIFSNQAEYSYDLDDDGIITIEEVSMRFSSEYYNKYRNNHMIDIVIYADKDNKDIEEVIWLYSIRDTKYDSYEKMFFKSNNDLNHLYSEVEYNWVNKDQLRLRMNRWHVEAGELVYDDYIEYIYTSDDVYDFNDVITIVDL